MIVVRVYHHPEDELPMLLCDPITLDYGPIVDGFALELPVLHSETNKEYNIGWCFKCGDDCDKRFSSCIQLSGN